MSKKRLPIIALLTASFISVTGDTLALVAIPWFVLQTTGSAVQTGVVAFFSVTPIILATFFGGVIVDRVGYKRISILADLASGLTIAFIPMLYQTTGLAFWQLLILVFLGNLLDAPGAMARRALLPELAEQARLTLERATALEDGVSRATRMIGAPLGGLLIAALGAISVLWLDALSFLVSAALIAIFVRQPSQSKMEPQAKPYLEDLAAGLRFVKNDALVMTLIVTVMITNMLDGALSFVILPVYAEQIYGASTGAIQLGWLIGISGGAAVLGTLLMSAYGEQFSRRGLFIGSFVIVAGRWFLLAAFPPFWILLSGLAILSLAIGPLNPIISTILYERAPADMRARVIGTITAGVLVATPLGTLTAGFLVEALGLRLSLIVCGVIYLVVVSHLSINPAFKGITSSPLPERL